MVADEHLSKYEVHITKKKEFLSWDEDKDH
jgi:hypothetical protein